MTTTVVRPVSSWIATLRPKVWTASIVPFVAGGLLAVTSGAPFNGLLFAFALLSALCIQIGSHMINDALDVKKGADTSDRLGPLRAIHYGLITFQQAYWAGVAFFLLALLFGVPLIAKGGAGGLALLLFCIGCAYTYTGGPFPLAYLGVADFFVFIFYGWVSTMAAYWLQAGTVDETSFLLGTQIGLLCTVMNAVNNLRDIVTDTKANKKTLAVRFGQRFAKMEITVLTLLPFLLGLFWLSDDNLYSAFLPLFVLPLAIFLVVKVWKTEPSCEYNSFLALAALLHMNFAGFLVLGSLIHAGYLFQI